MSTLTDRYVWAVVRTIPEKQRSDIERELRAAIEDAIDSRDDAAGDERSVERDVLAELGEPDRLAAGYTDWPTHLIGSAYFFDYRRLLTVLVATVVPIVVVVLAVVGVLSGDGAGDVIGTAVWTGIEVTVHLGFWVTLVFAIIERTTSAPIATWTPDDLPETPQRHGVDRSEVIAGIAFLGLFVVAVFWQRLNPFVATSDGQPIAVLNPDLWSWWLPYFIAVALVEVGFLLLTYRVGRWTWSLAFGNVALNVAFTVPAVWLALTGRLVDTRFLDEVGMPATTQDGSFLTIVAVVLVAVAVWDVADGFRRAWRARSVDAGPGRP